MAIKALMLRKKINDKQTALEELRSKDAEFEKREAELTASVEEAETEEEVAAVEEAVNEFETEKAEHEEKRQGLAKEISELEAELAEEERKQPVPAEKKEKTEERKENKHMETRVKFFGMDYEERNAFFENEDVKSFLSEVRTAIKEKRSLSNVGLTIPETMLPLIKQVAAETSKLASRVNKITLQGTGRQTVMGTIPEAVWTEMCANLNELNLAFNDVEVDGYKVGGFVPVCNASLEDNDINLTSELITALGVSIGKALDKAIVYGTGTKMPLGIVTRLAQATQPSDYPATARTWVKLSTTNIKTGTGKTGKALFQEIIKNAKITKNDYFKGGRVWLMSENTHLDLMAEALDTNMNGALVAGISNTMPGIGGEIIELDCIPDGDIVFGYMGAYLLAERAGVQLSTSEHVKFIQDQTVFKGTARYDGKPVIAEAFGLISTTTTAPTTTQTFATDSAN